MRKHMSKKQIMGKQLFEDAQGFEWHHTIEWLRGNLQNCINLLNANSTNPYKMCGHPDITGNLNQFFENDPQTWENFAESIKDKRLLEIGGSCFGVTAMWTFVDDRVLIDPLIEKIDAVLSFVMERSWYHGTKKYSQTAEKFIPELEGAVDGCIYVRNCLDHTAHPWGILDNIGKYAAPGCHLLLWNHITHPSNTPGHVTITEDPKEIEDYIASLGFEIVRPVIHGGPAGVIKDDHVDYGCVAIKR